MREMTPERRQLAEALGLEELMEEGVVIPGSVVRGLGLSDGDRRALFKSVHCESVGDGRGEGGLGAFAFLLTLFSSPCVVLGFRRPVRRPVVGLGADCGQGRQGRRGAHQPEDGQAGHVRGDGEGEEGQAGQAAGR